MGFVALCAAVAIERIFELRWSRAHEKRGVAREPAFPWMVALHAVTLVAAPLESRRLRKGPLVFLGAATALRAWALWSLGDEWSVRVLRPSPRGPRVVTRGPYRYIRHPNYLAVILELAALPLAGGAWRTALAATLANLAVLSRRIPFEEKRLFADRRYRRHFSSLPRFIPSWR